jgi:hypothetical protein
VIERRDDVVEVVESSIDNKPKGIRDEDFWVGWLVTRTVILMMIIMMVMMVMMMVSMMSDVPMYFSTLRTSDAGVLTPPLRSGVLLVPMRCNPGYGGREGRKRGRNRDRKIRRKERFKREGERWKEGDEMRSRWNDVKKDKRKAEQVEYKKAERAMERIEYRNAQLHHKANWREEMILNIPNSAIEISLSPALSSPCSSAGIALSMRAVRRFLTSGDESSMPRGIREGVVLEGVVQCSVVWCSVV